MFGWVFLDIYVSLGHCFKAVTLPYLLLIRSIDRIILHLGFIVSMLFDLYLKTALASAINVTVYVRCGKKSNFCLDWPVPLLRSQSIN
jgi:hypothetical protein